MADFLSVEITGNQALVEQLNQAAQRLQNPRDLLTVLGGTLVENINRRFNTKTDPQGNRWAELAPSTRKRYDQQDTPTKGKNAGTVVRRGTLLERTGQMINSLNANVSADQVEVGMNRLSDGGRWSIPLLHEFGTTKMPRRGIFLADPEAGTLGAGDEADLSADITAFLDDIFGV
jgi:phage gpG-like protein